MTIRDRQRDEIMLSYLKLVLTNKTKGELAIMQRTLLLAESDGCSVYQFRNETGDGTMSWYEIFPGAMLSFNDFHMKYFHSEFVPDRRVFVIDHCREGRMEYQAAENAYAYVEAGDMKLDGRKHHTGEFVFPANHYHGLSIAFDLDIAAEALGEEIKDFPVDLNALQDKFADGEYPHVISGMERTNRIFEELYRVPETIRIPYFKVKIMELLLCLAAMELPDRKEEKPYFYRTQVEKVKAVQRFLTEHYAERYTQEELAEKFDISMTGMKNCFRSIYGKSLGTWLTEYRMNLAAELLRSGQRLSVAEIAGIVGYDSASKFAMAFRKVMGMSPLEYRGDIR